MSAVENEDGGGDIRGRGQGNHFCLIRLISLRKESGAEEDYLWKEKKGANGMIRE
ncbi:hypothetical protein L195_g034629, partial [Trifolium pratense]